MLRSLWKPLVGMGTACALFASGTGIAQADDRMYDNLDNKETVISDSAWENTGLSLKESDYADTTARDLIENEIGVSEQQVDELLSIKISPSLNLENSSQVLSSEAVSGLSPKDMQIINSLPSVDEETGTVSIPNPETREMFSLGVKDHVVTEVVNGVARTQDKDMEDQAIAVSHVTADESGQIVGAIKNGDVTFMDFNYILPEGYGLEKRSDGGFSLVSNGGSLEGEIAAPWALDANGEKLATSFELVGGNTLRQHVNTEGAAFPVTLDPSWSWWLITAGKCAVSVAPLLVTGGAAILTRAPKLISFINKLSKTPKIAVAVSKVGGVKNAAVAAAKKAVIALRGKLPKGVASKLPSPKLTSKDKIFIAAAWPFLVDNFWDLIGIGSCYSLVRGK